MVENLYPQNPDRIGIPPVEIFARSRSKSGIRDLSLIKRHLLYHRGRLPETGHRARAFIPENDLPTRHLRDYLFLIPAVQSGGRDRITLT